jgi:hypothetical protein
MGSLLGSERSMTWARAGLLGLQRAVKVLGAGGPPEIVRSILDNVAGGDLRWEGGWA